MGWALYWLWKPPIRLVEGWLFTLINKKISFPKRTKIMCGWWLGTLGYLFSSSAHLWWEMLCRLAFLALSGGQNGFPFMQEFLLLPRDEITAYGDHTKGLVIFLLCVCDGVDVWWCERIGCHASFDPHLALSEVLLIGEELCEVKPKFCYHVCLFRSVWVRMGQMLGHLSPR